MTAVQDMDRLAMRGRPEGTPLMHQRWEKLLFLHWPVAPELLRPHVPEGLELDLFDGKAWLGITPFTIPKLNATGLPAIPGLRSFHEFNVRTYVYRNGVPGIWFFSLEASKLIPTVAARLFYSLPYRKSDISFRTYAHSFSFSSHRSAPMDADFVVRWKAGLPLPAPAIDSLEFFLVERYCLFAANGGEISSTRIYHVPWTLRGVTSLEFYSTMFTSLGLPRPDTTPIAFYANSQEVDLWAPEIV